MVSFRSDRLTVPNTEDGLKQRAALVAAAHAVDVGEARDFLEALGLLDYAARTMHRDSAGHLRYRKGQTPDAAR